MTRYGQIRHWIMSMREAIDAATYLMNNDPKRAQRTLRAIIQDLATLEELLNYWRPIMDEDL